MASQLCWNEVVHKRSRPVAYRFNYRVFSLKIDIDRFEDEAGNLRWLSLNRHNLLSVYFKDYGSRDGTPWRQWFDTFMYNYGLTTPAAKVELVCLPRVFGYSFNPLAMWYAYNDKQQLIAVVAEVSNTFGQWHHYVLFNQQKPLTQPIHCGAEKVFHVSPFIDMQQTYQFRFTAPTEKYHLIIKQYERSPLSELENVDAQTLHPSTPLLFSSQRGTLTSLTNANLLKAILLLPWQSLKVIGLIHWWAVKIWFKGGKFHKTPKALADVNYSHSAMYFLAESSDDKAMLAKSSIHKESKIA